MPRFDSTEFGRLLARLTPQELRQVEGMVAEARERAEAGLEIDARAEAGGPAASCVRCGGESRIRWGRTRTVPRDGAARAAGRHGRAEAARRSPGCIVPTSW
jgi:hypothetical protein